MNYTTNYIANLTSITDLTTLAQYSNSITGGYFGILFVVAVFAVSFGAYSAYRTEQRFAISAFFATTVCVLLAAIGLVNPAFVAVSVAVLAYAAYLLFTITSGGG